MNPFEFRTIEWAIFENIKYIFENKKDSMKKESLLCSIKYIRGLLNILENDVINENISSYKFLR